MSAVSGRCSFVPEQPHGDYVWQLPGRAQHPQVKRSAANFNAEELPLATSIFKGIDYTRQKGPPESLRVRHAPQKAASQWRIVNTQLMASFTVFNECRAEVRVRRGFGMRVNIL